MPKEATLQVRMDADLKEQAEALYRDMGTSFAEAVRIFAKQSVRVNGMPFAVTANKANAYGQLSKYVNNSFMHNEDDAFEKAVADKHEKTY